VKKKNVFNEVQSAAFFSSNLLNYNIVYPFSLSILQLNASSKTSFTFSFSMAEHSKYLIALDTCSASDRVTNFGEEDLRRSDFVPYQ
jgi:hypothetical protein